MSLDDCQLQPDLTVDRRTAARVRLKTIAHLPLQHTDSEYNKRHHTRSSWQPFFFRLNTNETDEYLLLGIVNILLAKGHKMPIGSFAIARFSTGAFPLEPVNATSLNNVGKGL